MINDYQRLPELLQRQRKALADQDASALETIGQEIGDLSQRIVNHALNFGHVENEAKAQLRTVIEQAQQEVGRNLQLWKESIEGLHGARKKLQATRRFYSSLQGQGRAGLRYSKTG